MAEGGGLDLGEENHLKVEKTVLPSILEKLSSPIGVLENKNVISNPNRALKKLFGKSCIPIDVLQVEAPIRFTIGTIGNLKLPIKLTTLDTLGDGKEIVELDVASSKHYGQSKTTLNDLASDGFWEWYPPTDYEYMSKRFWDILGYDWMVMDDSPSAWLDKLHKEDAKAAWKMYQKHVETRGEYLYDKVVRYAHLDGHQIYIRCRGAVVEWLPDGKPWKLIGSHTDVTQIRMKEAVEAKAKFVSQVSHEIRSPLCSILNDCETAAEYDTDKKLKALHERIVQSCSNILQISESVMMNSKVKNSKERKSQVKVSSMLNNILKKHREHASKLDISVALDIASRTEQENISIDVQHFTRALDNIISNAIKYTHLARKDRGKSNISIIVDELEEKNGENMMTISVVDSGLGISKEHWNSVFQEFSKVNLSDPGLGLGLYTSKMIAERVMKGSIEVSSSEVGKSTTFRLRVPVGQLNDIGKKSELKSKPKLQLRVLNVDDIALNRKIIRKKVQLAAKQLGLDIQAITDAENGQEAVDIFTQQEGNFNLILMDCLMPVLDGFQASRKILKYSKDITIPEPKVVAVTASVCDTLDTQCKSSGMCDVIHKPYTTARLKNVLKTLFKG